MSNQSNDDDNRFLDWDELSNSDQERAQQLLQELNEIFDKYRPREPKKNENGEQR